MEDVVTAAGLSDAIAKLTLTMSTGCMMVVAIMPAAPPLRNGRAARAAGCCSRSLARGTVRVGAEAAEADITIELGRRDDGETTARAKGKGRPGERTGGRVRREKTRAAVRRRGAEEPASQQGMQLEARKPELYAATRSKTACGARRARQRPPTPLPSRDGCRHGRRWV